MMTADIKLRSNDFLHKGMQQAFRNHMQMMEAPLIPLKEAVKSISKKFDVNSVKLS